MWLMSKTGFVSVVAYDPRKDIDDTFVSHTSNKTSHVLVRARVEEDLFDLKRVVPNVQIEKDTSADYHWRAVIKRKDFKKWLAMQADEINYDSHFKEVAEKHSKGVTGTQRHSVYMSVWSALMRLQKSAPYSGSGVTTYYSSAPNKYKKCPMHPSALLDERPPLVISTPSAAGTFTTVAEFVKAKEDDAAEAAKHEPVQTALPIGELIKELNEPTLDTDPLTITEDDEWKQYLDDLRARNDEATAAADLMIDASVSVEEGELLLTIEEYRDMLAAGVPPFEIPTEDLDAGAQMLDDEIYDLCFNNSTALDPREPLDATVVADVYDIVIQRLKVAGKVG